MNAKDKPKYITEARKLYEELSNATLWADPNNFTVITKINRLIAIFTNFSSNEGQELKRLFQEYQRWGRRSTHKGTIRNRAVDVLQFIGQKIEEMDIYVIEDIETKQKKIVEELENNNLWARTTIDGKDLHIWIGEKKDKTGAHAHFIVDSRTGEVRIDPKDQPPGDFIEKVVSITTKGGTTAKVIQQGMKATLEFVETDNIQVDNMPILYMNDVIGKSGGPNGHFAYFTIKNIGKVHALGIKWNLRGFAYRFDENKPSFDLAPNETKEVEYPISGEKVFTEEIPELNIVAEYKDVKGRCYFVRRDLGQVKVPSGAFYELEASSFHSPTLQVDDGLIETGKPVVNGDRYETRFKIKTTDGFKEVTIGISRTLLSAWGFYENLPKIAHALAELGQRKMRKMASVNKVEDYIFISSDFPADIQHGFEGYKQLRDSF